MLLILSFKSTTVPVISIVNVNAHHGWDNKIFDTNTKDGYLMLVNKFYKLDNSYKRDNFKFRRKKPKCCDVSSI